MPTTFVTTTTIRKDLSPTDLATVLDLLSLSVKGALVQLSIEEECFVTTTTKKK